MDVLVATRVCATRLVCCCQLGRTDRFCCAPRLPLSSRASAGVRRCAAAQHRRVRASPRAAHTHKGSSKRRGRVASRGARSSAALSFAARPLSSSSSVPVEQVFRGPVRSRRSVSLSPFSVRRVGTPSAPKKNIKSPPQGCPPRDGLRERAHEASRAALRPRRDRARLRDASRGGDGAAAARLRPPPSHGGAVVPAAERKALLCPSRGRRQASTAAKTIENGRRVASTRRRDPPVAAPPRNIHAASAAESTRAIDTIRGPFLSRPLAFAAPRRRRDDAPRAASRGRFARRPRAGRPDGIIYVASAAVPRPRLHGRFARRFRRRALVAGTKLR